MIIVNDLEKQFEENKILKGISTTFEKGITNLIIGQSGSGKTVFLKCILGLFPLDGGEITFDSSRFSTMNTSERNALRREIGMLFQGGALFDSLNVEENIMFPMRMFTNASIAEIRDTANEVIKRVNLTNSNKKYPSEISGGMKKRVAIARAIIMKPKYLFCDEPNSGLDPGTSIVIDNLIKEITIEHQITTVVVTHDMNSVMEIGDKIVFLKNGYKEWEGSNKELLVSDNKLIVDYVYSSNLLKQVRKVYLSK